MFRSSLRLRLVALYLAIAAVVVAFACVIGGIAIFEFDMANVRQSIATAMRDVPTLLESYDGTPAGSQLANGALAMRYQNTGIIARVAPRMPPPSFFIGRPPPSGEPVQLPPPRLGLFGVRPNGYFSVSFGTGGPHIETQTFGPGPGAGDSLFFRLFPMRVFPERIALRNGDVMIFPDPEHTRVLLDRYLVFASIFAAIMLVLAWRVADLVALHTLTPLIRTTDALNRFGDGDFTPEPVRTNDRSELGNLALAYNRAVGQITRALDERSKADREMRQFVGDAGHQLRTPLTVIMGYLSAFVGRDGTPRYQAALSSMLDESRRMKALIDDLIVLAKLEHASAADNDVVELNQVARDVVLSFTSLAHDRIAFEPFASHTYVKASQSELFSALAALVDNALKYGGESPITVSVRADAKNAYIDVADRGPGIAEGDLGKVFDRFYRGETSHGVMGTGLGLAIVRRCVERANGSVRVENRPEGGLVCTISLPKTVQTSAPILAA